MIGEPSDDTEAFALVNGILQDGHAWLKQYVCSLNFVTDTAPVGLVAWAFSVGRLVSKKTTLFSSVGSLEPAGN